MTADVPLVLALDDPGATVATAGGKGAALGRLARAGLPVPPGFHLTTRAYREYVAQDRLREPLREAVSAVDAADPATFEAVSRRIAGLFAAVPPPPGVTAAEPGTGGPAGGTVTGFAGAAGVVEGVARVLTAVEEAGQLGDGEILVTTSTNVGWTPVFPRAAAVVTDVGAPLSHAAIVARELGIPAVVGCGDATMRVHSGDRIRVDGGQGTVQVLQRA